MNPIEEYTEFRVSGQAFKKERPIGVSGIMRCHNCADFLESCIDSCIDGLDELVVVYHDCIDDTVTILQKKQDEYPKKIKIYEYKPYLFKMDMPKIMFEYTKKYYKDSVHLFSGYTNYAFSKASFRYVVKIDCDHIFFHERWKRLCNAYRSTEKRHINFTERTSAKLYHWYKGNYKHQGILPFVLKKVAELCFPSYESYMEKKVINEKTAVSLSGINLFYLDNKWTVSLGKQGVKSMYPLFNGVGDTFFFKLPQKPPYQNLYTEGYTPNECRIIELMLYKEEMLDGGFCWFHLKPMMQENVYAIERLYRSYTDRFISLNNLVYMPYRLFCKMYSPFFHSKENVFRFFFTTMKQKGIPWQKLGEIENIYKKNLTKKENFRMTQKDFYIEFYEEADRRINIFADSLKIENLTLLGKHDIRVPLITYLYTLIFNEKEHYNQCRKTGMDINQSMKRVDGLLKTFRYSDKEEQEEWIDFELHPWKEALAEYSGYLWIYLYNERQLHYLLPIIHRITRPVLLLLDFELPENIEVQDNIFALRIPFSSGKLYANDYLENNFPRLHQYTLSFDILYQLTKPCGIVCLEGCHIQEQILAVLGKSYDKPTICIQQGWPSFMRTGFRNLEFKYFFSWGARFNELWKLYNPTMQFMPMGYPYETATENHKRTAITFFLQAPVILSSIKYFDEMLQLVTYTASSYPQIPVLVREHPEYKIGKNNIAQWNDYPNIKIVSDWDLKTVYEFTKIAISHFSSCIMESALNGSIPLVYDPTSKSRYYPDIEKECIGYISKTPEDFNNSLYRALNDEISPLTRNKQQLKSWFASTSKETLDKIASFLNNL